MQFAPKSQNIEAGYDINAVRRKLPGGHNAFLTLDVYDMVALWVYEVQTAQHT